VNVLADTSVWVDHWRNASPRFAALLGEDRIILHPFILGELAMGTIASRSEALRHLSRLRTTGVAQNREVLGLIERTPLWGRGIGWVDAHLLAAALLDRIQLWTLDQQLHAAASELGVAL
jgi:predicted nucleic acid-binding protein